MWRGVRKGGAREGQWRFAWGTAGKGSRIRMWRTLAVSRLIQDHWFPTSFFLPHGHDLHCKWQFCCFGLFWSQKRLEGGGGIERGRSGVPTTHRPSTLHNLPTLPRKKKHKKNKPWAALLLLESSPLSQDPTTAASAVSQDFSSLLRKAQQAHCSVGRRLGQLCCS